MNAAGLRRKIIPGLFLTVMAVTAVIPLFFMFATSLTNKNYLTLIFTSDSFSLKNYPMIFRNFNIGRNFLNSFIVTGSACILNSLFSSMAAYAFAKKKFPFRETLFIFYLATIILPGQAMLIPVFTIMRTLHLINTYPALFLPVIGAFGVFLIRQFVFNIPDELLEAADIDGCGEAKKFLIILLPLLRPVLISLTIFTFISCWNDFLWPLVIIQKPEMQTLTLALSVLKGNYVTNYGLVMAGAVITFLPSFILFLALQKQFVEGIAISGIKG